MMGSQIQKCWVKLFSSARINHCARLRYQTALHQRHITERKLTTVCARPILPLREDENTDEFDEEYVYDFPDNIPREAQARISEIMQEIELHSQFRFHRIPSHLSSEDWMKLLEFDDVNKRDKHITRLYLKEKIRELKRKRAEDKRLFKNDERKLVSEKTLVPSENCQSMIFHRYSLYNQFKRFLNLRVMKSAIFGPHIIIDCSYESHMVQSELDSCVRQIAMTRKNNKYFDEPFNIIHCNVDLNGSLAKKLSAIIPNFMEPVNTFHYTEKSFLDLFPREKLIYLSPHSDTELETYDHDSVYIIGAMVDHTPKVGLSVEKADLHGIRTVKFPLERHVNWCRGTKCLMLFQAVNIMHDLKEGVPWNEILSENIQIPKRTYTREFWKESERTKDSLAIKYVHHFVENHSSLL